PEDVEDPQTRKVLKMKMSNAELAGKLDTDDPEDVEDPQTRKVLKMKMSNAELAGKLAKSYFRFQVHVISMNYAWFTR
ncbi:hypothetical protein Tco_0616913, partial [Tanacetum coccineum]